MTDRVQEIIAKIEASRLRDEAFPELVKLMHKLAAISIANLGTTIRPGQKLYRGTSYHESAPTRVEQIWHPPPNLARWNRANRPGAPMFYCCSGENGAFREIRVRVGSYAVLATWEATKELVVAQVGYAPAVLARAGATRMPSGHEVQFDGALTEEARRAREFLHTAFTNPDDTYYRVTAAIAEMYLATEPEGVLDGILYPAIQNPNVDNLALTPKAVETGLWLLSASVTHVDQVSGEGIGGRIYARLGRVDGRDLQWEYTGTRNSIPPGDGSLLVLKPGERYSIEAPGRMVLDGRVYETQVGYWIELSDGEPVVRNFRGEIVPPSS